jgi:hypothetical protein
LLPYLYNTRNQTLINMKNKDIYPSKLLTPFVYLFQLDPEKSELMKEQGWLITIADTDVPNVDYIIDKQDAYYRIDSDSDALEEKGLSPLASDVYDEMARKAGIIVDRHGVIRGFDGVDEVKRHNDIINLNKMMEAMPTLEYVAEVTAIITETLFPLVYGGDTPQYGDYEGISGAYQLIGMVAVDTARESFLIKDWGEFLKDKPHMGWDEYLQELAVKKLKERFPEKKKFNVTVLRKSYQWAEIEVEAETRQDAIILAENMAGDYDYKEKDADYTIEYVAEVK